MKIKVEVRNALLGDSVFWEGDSDDYTQIRNYPIGKFSWLDLEEKLI